MAYQQYKSGPSPAYVKSFRWVKPGKAEAEVVQEAVKRGDPEPSMPNLPIGGMLLESFYEDFRDGIGTRRWIYKRGDSSVFKSSSGGSGGDANVWTADISLMQRPISMHPKLDSIMATFGGVLKNGTIQFPPRRPNGMINPMYMVESYFAPTMTVSYEGINNASPSVGSIGGLGYIDTPGPNAFSFCAGEGEWLLIEHEIQRQGGESVERKTWKYGGPGGWVRQLYS